MNGSNFGIVTMPQFEMVDEVISQGLNITNSKVLINFGKSLKNRERNKVSQICFCIKILYIK